MAIYDFMGGELKNGEDYTGKWRYEENLPPFTATRPQNSFVSFDKYILVVGEEIIDGSPTKHIFYFDVEQEKWYSNGQSAALS